MENCFQGIRSVLQERWPIFIQNMETTERSGYRIKQDQVTQKQIFSRLKEEYGDRETVARNARYTVRSFVAWNILQDSNNKGCYKTSDIHLVNNHKVAALLLESALHANPEGKTSLSLLLNNPGFFPFTIPLMTGESITQRNKDIDVLRYGFDDEVLKLKNI